MMNDDRNFTDLQKERFRTESRNKGSAERAVLALTWPGDCYDKNLLIRLTGKPAVTGGRLLILRSNGKSSHIIPIISSVNKFNESLV